MNVRDFGAAGDGIVDDLAAIVAARDAAVAFGNDLIFPPGTYAISDTLALGYQKLSVHGEGFVVLQYTGSSNQPVVTIDAGTSDFLYDHLFENFTILGNGNQDGLFVRNFPHRVTRNIRVWNVSRRAFDIEGDVSSLYENCIVTPAGSVPPLPAAATPVVGFLIDGTDICTASTDCQFVNCVVELASSVGWELVSANANSWLGGTSEGLEGTGITISSNSTANLFANVFCEGNAVGGDLACYGQRNRFINCQFSSRSATAPYEDVKSVIIKAGGAQNRIEASYIYAATVEATAVANVFSDIDAGFAITDSGTQTQILNTRQLYNSSTIFPGLTPGNIDDPSSSVLDWYQEGSFTPSFGGTTSDGSISYDIQEGQYTRIGNRLIISLLLRITNIASRPTGYLCIRGLPPINAAAVPADHALAVGEWSNLTLPMGSNQLTAYVASGTQLIMLVGCASGAAETLLDGSGLAATLIGIAGSYQV